VHAPNGERGRGNSREKKLHLRENLPGRSFLIKDENNKIAAIQPRIAAVSIRK
jgi:hypothetical protein